MTHSDPIRILVLDIETPWVSSLITAMPESVTVDFLGILNWRERQYKPQCSLKGMFCVDQLGAGRRQRYMWTLSRLRRMTTAWLWCYCKTVFGGRRWPHVVVVTDPWKLRFLGAFTGIPVVYYAHDVFEYYSHWNRHQVRECEQKLLERCDVVAAVARKLQQDFKARVDRDVLYLPMAVDRKWLDVKPPNRPADLPTGTLVVGCTGNVNWTYHWELIERIAIARPDVAFVFVGPNIEGDSTAKAEIDRIGSLPNVYFLGSRPHEQLRAYIHAFDVCFCPLVPGDHSDRRSPLRLFDYLTTARPVISTDIAEAHEHGEHVLIAADVESFNAHLERIQSGAYMPDALARRHYMEGQTWDARARVLLDCIQAACFKGAPAMSLVDSHKAEPLRTV